VTAIKVEVIVNNLCGGCESHQRKFSRKSQILPILKLVLLITSQDH